ncbi:MAG: hypothetical protein KGQ37_04585 [Hyphomicrobiales bacterium]|nr:hypothetical protein [Hyphomicrobiales bacterium]
MRGKFAAMEKQATFGRRGQGTARSEAMPRAPAPTARLDLDLTPEQRAAILGPAGGSAEPGPVMLSGTIGWSRRAAFLSMTIVSVLDTAVSVGVLQHRAPAPLLKTLGAPPALGSAITSAALPLSLLAHLVDGALAGGTSLWLAHHLLRRIDRQSLAAHAVAGAAMSGFWAVVSGSLFGGMLPAHMEVTLATGGAAAALYRIFAGRTA